MGASDDLRAELGGGGKGAVEAARGDAGSAECAESGEPFPEPHRLSCAATKRMAVRLSASGSGSLSCCSVLRW